jgi:hypothetical protein
MAMDFEEVLAKIRVYGADWARQSLNAGVQNGLFSGGVWVGEGDRSPQPGCIGLEGSIVKSTSIGCITWRSSVQSISTATWTAISFDTDLFDSDDIHSVSLNPDRLVINHGGLYYLHAHLRFAANASGSRQIQIQLNGSTTLILQDALPASQTGGLIYLEVNAIYPLNFQDYIRLVVYHTTGGSLSVDCSAYLSPILSAVRLP